MDQAFRRSLSFDRHRPEHWIGWTGRVALLLTGLAAWVVPDWDLFLRASLSALSLVGLLVGIGLSAIDAYRPHLLRLVEACLAVLILGNWTGHLLGLYGGTTWFDVALHGLGGLLAGLAGFWLARATELFWDRGDVAPFRAFWIALSAALVMGALFEVAEFGADAMLGTETQNTPDQTPHDDTMTDIMAESGTGLAAGLGVAWWTRRRNRGKATAASAADVRRERSAG